MKVVILAGGKGLRLSEKTKNVPKPLVEILNKPIIEHIIEYFNKQNFQDFYLLLGYKSKLIKNYFINYYYNNSDIRIDLSNNNLELENTKKLNCKLTLIDSGLDTMTGGRINYFKKYLGNDKEFFVTYSDALTDLNLKEFVDDHISRNSKNSLVLSKLKARFGKADIDSNNRMIKSFYEKNDKFENLINSGYYIFNKEIFDYIDSDSCVLESDILPKFAKDNSLSYFEHTGYWQPMDNIRERDLLEEYLIKKNS